MPARKTVVAAPAETRETGLFSRLAELALTALQRWLGKNSKRTWSDRLEDHKGTAVVIWCVRYAYRGIVAEVGEDFVTLSNPRAVEVSGPSTGERPTTEDIIPSDLDISIGAIEQVSQPAWVWYELDEFKPKA